tara:strand:+ start:329 stop:628 length:300 start_codon:yes stop_codon:yes gene_type:complete
MLIPLVAAGMLTACGAPYEPEPVSPWQWQQRQDRIEREAAREQARCLSEVRRTSASAHCDSGQSVSRDPKQCDGSELGVHAQVVEKYPDGSCLISWSAF